MSTSVANTTSDTQPQKRARSSNATKKGASNAQITRVNDPVVSELSMPESSTSQSGKRQNDKSASLSKVSMKSKSSMTKTKPKPAKKTIVCIGIVFIFLVIISLSDSQPIKFGTELNIDISCISSRKVKIFNFVSICR